MLLFEQDYDQLASEITRIVEDENESIESLEETIGRGLFDEGYEPSEEGALIIQEMLSLPGNNKVARAFNFLKMSEPETEDKAKDRGRKFMERFKVKLQQTICNSEVIGKIFDGESSLKEALMVFIPLLLAALGITSLNPVWLGITVAVVAIILKSGYDTYCEVA